MAKDRRQNGRSVRKAVSKARFVLRIVLAAAAVTLVVVALVMAFSSLGKSPSNGGDTAATTTLPNVTAPTTLAPTTEVTTTTTEAPTTTTSEPPTVMASVVTDDILLVNAQHTVSSAEIASYPVVHFSGNYYVHEDAVESLRALMNAGAEYGLSITSAYRSYDTQDSLYKNKVQRVINSTGMSYEDALVEAATVVARPGTSEHHTGLAIDFLHEDCGELEEYWDQSPAFDWMVEHCADYGFILRYPKEKQHITGVIYEPWHYRYVGVTAAKEIMARGITLEEYLGKA